jgi:hypothetical protein
MRLGKMVSLILVPALALIALEASAATRFNEELGIYSLDAPEGWKQIAERGYVDVVYDAPGAPDGQPVGGIFAGVKPAERPMTEEIAAFVGTNKLVDRRSVTIGGLPCETASVAQGEAAHNTMLFCHFVVPFQDGPRILEFFMGGAAPVAQAESYKQAFWQVASSVRWGAPFPPGP